MFLLTVDPAELLLGYQDAGANPALAMIPSVPALRVRASALPGRDCRRDYGEGACHLVQGDRALIETRRIR